MDTALTFVAGAALAVYFVAKNRTTTTSSNGEKKAKRNNIKGLEKKVLSGVSDAVDTTKKVWEPKPVTECHIQYRVGTVQDCDHIRRVFFSTGFVYYEEADAPTEFYFNAKWNGIWAKRLISSDQVYIVAETVKYPGYPEIVGFARFQRGRKLQNNDSGIMTKDFSVELMSLFVLPEWKRRGIGKRMLCIAASHAIKAFSVEKAFCWCVDDENSRAFYQSMGCCVLLTKEDHGTQTAFNLDLNALRLLGERLGANIG